MKRSLLTPWKPRFSYSDALLPRTAHPRLACPRALGKLGVKPTAAAGISQVNPELSTRHQPKNQAFTGP
jgi:hypothetical protein